MSIKPLFCQLKEFDPREESYSTYEERVALFFQANDVAEDMKVPVFLSMVGFKNYALLRDLLIPAKPSDKSLDDLLETLKKHFDPTPSVLGERFNFHCHSQGNSESIAEYVAELKCLATHCSFEAYLDEALRDRFVFELKETAIQKRLLA